MEESFEIEVLEPEVAIDALGGASSNFPFLIKCIE